MYVSRKNAIRGRQLEPPIEYKEAMEVVTAVLQKNGHSHLSNLCAVDPYLTRNSRNEEIKQLKEKVRMEWNLQGCFIVTFS